jgi:hypothetical protein
VTTTVPIENQHGDRRDPAQPLPRQPSMLTNMLITAVVSLSCGAAGAMGYSHFFGPDSGDSHSSHSQADAGSHKESTANRKSGGGSTAESAHDPSTQASTASSVQEFNELKQQITKLGQRIDRLGEQVDRSQTMLSLALPLLQRIAPKN